MCKDAAEGLVGRKVRGEGVVFIGCCLKGKGHGVDLSETAIKDKGICSDMSVALLVWLLR